MRGLGFGCIGTNPAGTPTHGLNLVNAAATRLSRWVLLDWRGTFFAVWQRLLTMSKYRKPFIGILTLMWAAKLPEWQPGLSSPAFYTNPEATFSWTRFAPDNLSRFHAFIKFSDKWAGALTCDIFITDSSNQNEPIKILRFSEDIPSRKPGAYRIGFFICGQDVCWRLRDEAAESNLFWKEKGLPGLAVLRRRKQDWYAKSYDVPPRQIMEEAAADLTNKFLTHVIPKLIPG